MPAERDLDVPPWVENRPSRRGRALQWSELRDHRGLAWFLAGRDLKVRYKQAAFGAAWAFVQPLASGIALTLVFRRLVHVPSDGIPYLPFVMLAYAAWALFSSGLNNAAGSLVGSGPLVTKVYFPRLLVPFAAILPSFVDFALAMIPLAVVMGITGAAPGAGLVTLPVWIAAIGAVSFGVGLVFAALNVRYRDAGALLGLLTQLWFFASPVIYPASRVHGWVRWVYALNPISALLSGLRWSVLGGPWPGVPLAVSCSTAAVALAAGMGYFSRAERSFADLI